jgi:ribonuclease G
VKTELIIRSNSSDIDFALLKDGKLTALNNETNGNKFSVGDIFLAKIGKVLSGLNASFVNVGYAKDGFLHYHDLGAQLLSLNKFIKGVSTGKIRDYTLKYFHLEKDIDKHGGIIDILKTGQNLLVQIVKEPISTKGPRMSSEISIAGRYLVLVPFSERVSVSQKIMDPLEKERLKRLIKSIK